MFDVKVIGSRMKRRREELDLTLDEVANSVGVAKSTILRYENGEISRPKIPVLHSIANALDVLPEWLLGQSDQMKNEDCWDWDGSCLKMLRQNSGITAEEAAFRLGIPVTRYQGIENSTIAPTVTLLHSMSQVFCTSIDLLLGVVWPCEHAGPTLASYTKKDIELITRYHRASDEAKRIVDLALSPYGEENLPKSHTESVG